MLNSVNTSYIVKRQHQLVWFIEIKCRILKYWASMLTNPNKLSSRVYNVLLMLLMYNNNDYKSPWLKYVENTLNVKGLLVDTSCR